MSESAHFLEQIPGPNSYIEEILHLVWLVY